jgi:TolB-like protein
MYRRVAVLPFRNLSADLAESDFLADGFSQSLITKLTQVSAIGVTPWVTAQRFSDLSVPLGQVANELQVDALIVGTYARKNDSLQVTLSLVDRGGLQRWGDELSWPYAELIRVQREIALSVAGKLLGKISARDERSLQSPVSQSAGAYEYYLRASYALQQGDEESYNLADGLFHKALDLDPNLAEAYVGIGAVQTGRVSNEWAGGDLAGAEAAFLHALQLNPSQAVARRGLIRYYWLTDQEEKCLEQGRQAQEQGGESVENLLVRGEAYIYGNLFEEAEALFKQVLALDPLNEAARVNLTMNQFCLRKYAEATELGEAYLRQFGDDYDVHHFVAESYHCLGDFERAKQQYVAGIQTNPGDVQLRMALASLLRQNGRADDAREVLMKGLQMVQHAAAGHPEDLQLQLNQAFLLAQLGKQQDFSRLEARLMKERPGNAWVLLYMGYDHAFLGELDAGADLMLRAIRMGTSRCGRVSFLYSCLEVYGLEDLKNSSRYDELLKATHDIDARFRAKYGSLSKAHAQGT